MWGCFLMSGVKILHFLKDWWKSIPIHQNYTMALMLNHNFCLLSKAWIINEILILELNERKKELFLATFVEGEGDQKSANK